MPDLPAWSRPGPWLDANWWVRGTSALDKGPRIQAAIDAARDEGPGARLLLRPEVWQTGQTLIYPSNVVLEGVLRSVSVLKLGAGVNAPILKTENFDALTLTGNNTGGAHTFAIRDLTLDGNASQQGDTAPFGVGIYGYDYELSSVAIRNFLSYADALYTEWGALGGAGLAERGMEAWIKNLSIHDNTIVGNGAAWHNRGPHDTRCLATVIHNNPGAFGYWAETQGFTITVTAGSNGADVATFAGAATLNVTTTLGYPSGGRLIVQTSNGPATIAYTGKTAQTFLGCTLVSGSGTLATGAAVTPVGGGYAGTATLIDQLHIWGSHTIAAVLDAGAKISNSELEGAVTGQLLARAGECAVLGGRVFYLPGTSNPGYGIQIGDSVNTCNGLMLTDVDMTGFQGLAAATSAINIVASASGKYSAAIYQPTGRAIFGTFQANERRQFTFRGGTTFPAIAGSVNLGAGAPAANVSNADDHRGVARLGTGAVPVAGGAATVTFAQQRPGTPTVTVSPANQATAALQPYAYNVSSTGFSIGFNVAPAAAQPANTYEIAYQVEG